MKTIKFRAWDKHKKVMVMNDEVNPYGCGSSFSNLNDDIEAIQKDFKLMQFTGLTDRNDKEIYEGDVIYVRRVENYSGFIMVPPQTLVVTWRTIHDNSINHIQGSIIDLHYGLEVMGNIYENPELLKEVK